MNASPGQLVMQGRDPPSPPTGQARVQEQNRPVHRRPQRYLQGELAVVIDCSDLGRSADFWCAALGYVTDGVAAGRYRSLVPAGGTGVEVLLQRVPDAKVTKNRVHLDLRSPRTRARGRQAHRHRRRAPQPGCDHGGPLALARSRRSGRERVLRPTAAARLPEVAPPAGGTSRRRPRRPCAGRLTGDPPQDQCSPAPHPGFLVPPARGPSRGWRACQVRCPAARTAASVALTPHRARGP
jgi:Glyoxalase-like domain